ncbi:twin-arginine translocase TatA/TatE family subunit [Microbacterium invictum]|uniref:Twin-arginine translocase TatA/TatE family subunit n=1 Tax=Microbacterium invictum TaxID=515415 RepID=A0ABZ0VA96_9MICO|nr:twin-arginine translocase TatA/TatE family subunit [Microbacterium invictum]WQB70540.1 twin-arginine translocase TatA/TatE family subunit [Microbacterium invictum]
MFGLTFEKLFVVAVLAALIIGPHRLPHLARRAGEIVRGLRAFVESTRTQAENDLGVPLDRARWETMDFRQYDPRRIVREALEDAPPPRAGTATSAVTLDDPVSPGIDDPDISSGSVAELPATPRLARPSSTGRGQKYVVSGSAAHPRRILVPASIEEDAAPAPATKVAPSEENAGVDAVRVVL